MASIDIFFSLANAEFADYVPSVREKLSGLGYKVTTQSELVSTGSSTLARLDSYIHHCDMVVHLAGNQRGSTPRSNDVAELLSKHTDLLTRLHFARLPPEVVYGFSYTEWEAYLALYYNKRLIVCEPLNLTPNQSRLNHLERLKPLHGDVKFADPSNLVSELKSVFLTLLTLQRGGQNVTKSEPFDEGPYVGLSGFTEKQGDIFHGRADLTRRLRDKVLKRRLVAVVGPSGAGKTSLVQAGLIGALRKEGWSPLMFRPGALPFESFASVIAAMPEAPFAGTKVTRARNLINRLKAREHGVYKLFSDWLAQAPQGKLLLFINQFEELFTSCKDPDSRSAFLTALCDLPESDRLRVVVALRNDYINQTIVESGSSDWISFFPVVKMNPQEVEEAIRAPARLRGVEVEDEVVEKILIDAGNSEGVLPLLEFCLANLWAMRKDDRLSMKDYEAIGGLRGCIVRKAEEVFELLDPADQDVALRVLPHLVKIAENAKDRLTLGELCNRGQIANPRDVERVLDAFQQQRLIVMDGETGSKEHYFEFAHEAVFRNWGPLQQLLIANRDRILWRQHLRLLVNAWQASGKDDNRLLSEDDFLETQQRLTVTNREMLEADEREFFLQSERRHQQRTLDRIEEQVNTLRSAKVESVPALLAKLQPNVGLLKASLERLAPGLAAEEQWKVRLLLAGDREHEDWMANYIFEADPEAILILREALLVSSGRYVAQYWAVALSATETVERRIRAAGALALFDSSNDDWNRISAFVANRIVREMPRLLRGWINVFASVAGKLLENLYSLIQDWSPTSTVRSAALVLAEFAAHDSALLTTCACEAAESAYEEIFARIQPGTADQDIVVQVLSGIVAEEDSPAVLERERLQLERWSSAGLINRPDSSPELNREAARVQLGKRRSGAAITLLRLGHLDWLTHIFSQGDPEARSQLISRFKSRGIRAEHIVNCLFHALDNATAMYALLLALGDFPLSELPEFAGAPMVLHVERWFRSHEDSGIHGACGWLLRRWKHDWPQDSTGIRSADALQESFSAARQWQTLEVGSERLTLISVAPGKFMMGSGNGEAGHSLDETPVHEVSLTQRFALSEFPVTRSLFHLYLTSAPEVRSAIEDVAQKRQQFQASMLEPQAGISWSQAVGFCRWLTQQAGLGEEDQSYVPASPDAESPYVFRSGRRGFRLPSEAEREYACRAHTQSAFNFGDDRELLRCYGWFMENAGRRPREVGGLRPDRRGLSDMHGNVFEWCNDWYGPYGTGDPVDPAGPPKPLENQNRSLRGGGWYSHADDCRSAARNLYPSGKFFLLIGFRVACSLWLP